MTSPRLSLQRTDGDTLGATRRAMEQAGLRDRFKSGMRVLVKPNFATLEPRVGVTTSPLVLEAVLGTLRDRGVDVIVGEGDGGYASFQAREAFERHDVAALCRRTGATAIDLSEHRPTAVRENVLGREVDVMVSPEVLGKIDGTVSVPVMKTHFVTRVSLGLKNLWGCDADGMRLLRRKHLSRRLVLLAKTLKVNFTVIDATVALDGYGPVEGNPVPLDHVLAADNIVAADAAAARWMGINPERVRHIAHAARAGLGPINAALTGSPPLHRFSIRRGIREYAILATFGSSTLARLVYDSRWTPWVYRAFGRTPKRRAAREWAHVAR